MRGATWAVGLWLGLLAGTAAATPVTTLFKGQLDDPFGTLPVGTTFQGSFTYDYPQAPRKDIGVGRYYTFQSFTLQIATLNGTFGDVLAGLSPTLGGIRVFDNGAGYPDDLFELTVLPSFTTPVVLGGQTLQSISFVLQDLSGTAFSSKDLPPALDFAKFDHMPGPSNPSFLQLQGDRQFARGRLAAVPEPASFASLAAGAIALLAGWYRHRRA